MSVGVGLPSARRGFGVHEGGRLTQGVWLNQVAGLQAYPSGVGSGISKARRRVASAVAESGGGLQ